MSDYNYEAVFGTIGGPKEQAEPGAYRARLVSIMEKTAKATGEPFLVWTFSVDGAEIVVSGSTSIANGPESKAWAWSAALLGREPVKDKTKTTDLIGQPCTVAVSRDQRGYAKVTSVNPWPEGRTDAQTVADEPLNF